MKLKLHRIFILLFCLNALNIFSQSLGNNSCATAVVIPTTGVCVTGNNNTATSTGDGTASCFTVENGVWFRFTAPASGIVDITTSDAATNFDTQLTLYSGTCGALTELACDDQSGALPNSALIHYECLTPGQTYYVMLDGFAGDIGTFCIKLTTVSNPLNDFCTCATTLPLNGTCLVNQTTIGATDGWTGIVGCQSGDNPEVWYTFVADSSSVTFNVTAGTMGGNIEMILGEAPNCSSTFTTVGSYCAPSSSSHTFLNLTIGATYYLTISSSGAAGTFTICGLSSTPIPLPGQDCATAAELCSNAPFGQSTSSAGFGIQEVNPANSCWGSGGERQSRWYKFTVGASGTLGFVIDPVVNTDDYDWAIWDITTAGCPSTLSATPDAIACNWWGTMPPTTDIEGSTGLSTFTTDIAICASQPGAVDNDAGTAGCQPFSFVNFQTGLYGPLTVQAGRTYAILIDNFSISNNGFNFSFGGTAHIGPVADFVSLKSCTSVTLAGGPATSNTTYNWNFGDGNSSAATYSVAHTYTAAGSYTTSLLTTDALGCSASINSVVDLGNPSLVVSPLDTICSGSAAQLLSTATPNSPQLTFTNNTSTAIPNNNATGINSTIAVSGITPSTISGNQMVKVCLNITHPTDDNLDVVLTCPSGNTVILTSDNGGSGANYSNTCFTGIIATPITANITPATAPFNTGYYNAETDLSTLNSCNINGNWTLNVADDAGGSTGTLNSWSITFNTTSNTVAYSWAPAGSLSASNIANPVASPTTTTIYTVTATDGQGCAKTATTQVFVKPLPVPSITSSNTLCLGSSLTFTGSGANTYTWTTGGSGGLSATTGSIVSATPSSTGNITYTATVTGTNNCVTSAIKTITVNPIPTANASVSNTLTCTNTTISLTGTGGGTYSWSGPGITSGSTTATPSVNAPGNYSLVVTSAAGCPSSITTVSVSQNTVVTVVNAAASAVLNCTLTSVNASATTTTTPVSYNWSGTGITSAANISTITVNQPGTFNYTVTNTSNGCTATGSQAVTQNTTAPILTMPSSQTITCASPTVSLIASANPSTATPVWTGGVCAGANSYTASACSANTYTLTVTNNTNGCISTGTVSVVPSTGIPSVIASNSGSITCSTTTAQIAATTTMTPVSYSWTGPGSVSGSSSPTGTVNVGGTYQCVVTNTITGCTATVTTLVPTNTTAVAAAIAPTSSINCLITTQILNATPTGPFSYSWTPSSGLTGSSVSNPTVSVGGTYSVVITNTVNGCFGNASTTVVSNTIIPTVTISPSSFTTTCTTPTVQLTANTSTNSVNYTWTVPATGTLSNVSSSNPIASGAGIFTVVVTNTVNGCVSTAATSSITINVSVPTATLASNNLSITCVNPAPGTSVSTSTSSVNYIWTPSSGIASGANTSSPTFTLAGTYSVVITNTINGCSSNASSNTVTVTLNNTIPTISITPSQTLTCTTPSITITTTVNPSSGLSYNWTGSGVTGATTNSVSVNQAGVYSATVTNPVNGCFVTTSVAIASNTTAPIANIAVNSITTTCAAPTATLNASSTPSTGVSYNWSAPGSGSLNTFTVSNPVAGGSGIFTVTVIDNTNGCSTAVSQATVEVVPDAATPIINVSANNLTITCTNTTVTTALTSTNSIASYNWNPSPVSGGANPVFDTPGIYTATVTATNGCPTNVSVNVGIDITVPTASLSLASNNGTLTCLTTSITLTPTVSPISNLTYTWSPSIGLASNINQASATFSAAGVYTLAITNTITGCVSSLTNTANTFTVIEDNASPSFTLGTASSVTTTCASPNATLSATSDADPNSVYVWTTPTSSTVTGNPIVSSATGIYSVIVTNTINGCSTSASSQSTVEVVADSGIPNITLSSNSVSITCSNPTPSVSITTTASPVSYSWSPASGIVSGTETTANPIFTLAGTYSVIVTNTVSGCATSISSNVVNVILDNTIPVITLSSSVNDGTITCINSSVTITPSVTPNSNITYTWSPSGVVSSSINDATFSASGIYTLAITNTLTGCVNTTTNSANTFTVYLNTTTPTITTNAISSNTVIGCSNSTVSFSTNVTANGSSLTYTWSTGVNTPTIDITTAGVYSVVVTDSDNGCLASSQFTVEGNTITPQGVNAGANTSIPCGSNSLTLTGVSTSTNVNYSWSGPSTTSILSGSNTATPVVTEVGTYTLTVTDNQTGCQSTSTVNVSQTNVTAAFTANPTSGTSPLTVTFTDASSGANNWSWNFGDTSPVQTFTSNPASLSTVYSTGTYTASLTASSGSCTSTYTVLIVVEDGLTLEIPNVFTPNSDGANDVFTINSSGVKEISLQIFNRWGQILHEFTGPKASWDGLTPNGNLAPTGTYFFFVKATGFDDKVIEKNGVLSLFR